MRTFSTKKRFARVVKVLLLSLLCVRVCVGCDLSTTPDDDPRDERFLGSSGGDYAFTLDIKVDTAADANNGFTAERVLDSEMRTWHIQRTIIEEPDRFSFVMFNVSAIDEDGIRYGCAFRGKGNPVSATVEDGFCLLKGESPGDFIRLEVTEDADVSIHDRDSGHVLLDNMRMERVHKGWQRMRGTGRISMRKGFSFGMATNAKPSLDTENPPEDPWGMCPSLPRCVQVDLRGNGTYTGDVSDEAACLQWMTAQETGVVVHRISDDAHLWWENEAQPIYPMVRDARTCSLLGFSGSLNTRNDYVVDFEDDTFSMQQRSLYTQSSDGVPITVMCEGEWMAPLKVVDCPR